MANLSLKKVQSGATLLKKLLTKADNGDKTLTESEVSSATGSKWQPATGTPPVDTWGADPTTVGAMLAAVRKQKVKSDRSLDGIKKAVDTAVKNLESGDVDGSGTLSPTELKKVKGTLEQSLAEFARLHAGDSVSDFDIKPDKGSNWAPSKPFIAPKNVSAAKFVDALIEHFDSWANDNSMAGKRPNSITRYVLGQTETKGIVGEISKLPDAKAKAVLTALSKRIKQKDLPGFNPKRIYVEPDGVKLLDALAKKLGLQADFKGSPKAPTFNYY